MIPLMMGRSIRSELYIVYWSAAAIAAHVLESGLPSFGPWFKMGLANIFVLVAWYGLGWRAAMGVSILRVVIVSLVMGTFLSPTFFLSLAGAMGALAAMGLAHVLPFRLGPIGLSIPASMAHMTAQVVMAYFLILNHSGLFIALPWFLVGSWITGVVNGLAACLILKQMGLGGPGGTLPPGGVQGQRPWWGPGQRPEKAKPSC